MGMVRGKGFPKGWGHEGFQQNRLESLIKPSKSEILEKTRILSTPFGII